MSIFFKICPECAQSQGVTSTRCGCGYRFDSHDPQERPEIEMIAEDEKLYQEYLVARAAQAHEEVAIVRAASAGEPQNRTKSAQLRNAEQALQAILVELAEQNAKTDAAAAVARKTRHSKPKTPKTQPKLALVKPVAPNRVARPVTPAPKTAAAAIPPTPATPKIQPTRRAKFAKRPPSGQDRRPNEAFRVIQAAKAGKALQEARAAAEAHLRVLKASKTKTESKVQAPAPAPAPMPVPTPVRVEPARAVGAPKAVSHAAKRIKPAAKECPNCTAAVAEQVNHCRCGYAFPIGGPELPGIPLDAATLSILASDSISGGIGRRG